MSHTSIFDDGAADDVEEIEALFPPEIETP